MVNDAAMSMSKTRNPVSFSSLVLSAAIAVGASEARLAQAADPHPAKAEVKAKAEDKPAKTKGATAAAAKEVTVKGEMTCAKCGLRESEKCQNVLRVKDAAGKETKYYLAKNPVSEEQHEKVCVSPAPATVTGKVSDEGGKKVMTASAVKFD